MRLMKILCYFFCCFLSLSVYAFSTTQKKSQSHDYHHYTLKNGLEVVILPNNKAPVVYHSLWYKVGSGDSPQGKTGLAHFLEHLMFKGTEQFPNDTFKRTVNDLGGEQNANTSWDRTVYYVTIAKEHLPLILSMEADRMQHLVLTESIVDKEKDVVLQERRSVVDARPEACLMEAANHTFFWEHPYGKPIIGYEEDIRQYTKDDALRFYQTWYAPNNAILVIAGDVDIATLKPLIQQFYGPLKNKAVPARHWQGEPQHRGVNTKVEIRDPQIGGVFFQRIYTAPNFRTKGLQAEATVTLLQQMLGDDTFGRLSQSLVQQQKLAQIANTQYVGYFYDPYSLTVTATPTNTNDLFLLEASVESEIRRFMENGASPEELKIAKEQANYHFQYRQDSIQGLAYLVGESLSVGYTLKDLDEWPNIIQAVTADEVKIAAKNIFSKGPSVTAYGYPVAQK